MTPAEVLQQARYLTKTSTLDGVGAESDLLRILNDVYHRQVMIFVNTKFEFVLETLNEMTLIFANWVKRNETTILNTMHQLFETEQNCINLNTRRKIISALVLSSFCTF